MCPHYIFTQKRTSQSRLATGQARLATGQARLATGWSAAEIPILVDRPARLAGAAGQARLDGCTAGQVLKFRKLTIWICKKFNREELLELIDEINLILKDKYSDLKPRDDFKEKHLNYKNFKIDPLAPLEAVELSKPVVNLNYKELLNRYLKEHTK